jgi:hypothetical protein
MPVARGFDAYYGTTRRKGSESIYHGVRRDRDTATLTATAATATTTVTVTEVAEPLSQAIVQLL